MACCGVDLPGKLCYDTTGRFQHVCDGQDREVSSFQHVLMFVFRFLNYENAHTQNVTGDYSISMRHAAMPSMNADILRLMLSG